MANIAGVGWAQSMNGREAAMSAVQQALGPFGSQRPAAGFVFVSQELNPAECLATIANTLPNTALWGFSTLRPVCEQGELARGIMILLLGGMDLRAQGYWQPEYSQNSGTAARNLAQALSRDQDGVQVMLMALDGLNGDPAAVLAALAPLQMNVIGCLSNRDVSTAKTMQICGANIGSGSLAAMALGGRVKAGIASGQAWLRTGLYYRVTQARGAWVQALDGRSPAEVYGQAFDFPARDWGFPPLKTLARLYPLGVESGAGDDLVLHAPLHVEVDGSLRMNVPLQVGQVVHLMMGDPQNLAGRVSEVTRAALNDLGRGRPSAALILLDEAHRHLLDYHAAGVFAAARAELGSLPFAMVYTLGQTVKGYEKRTIFANNSISAIVFGTPD